MKTKKKVNGRYKWRIYVPKDAPRCNCGRFTLEQVKMFGHSCYLSQKK